MVHQGATQEGIFFVNSYMLVPVCTDSDVYADVYFSLVCLQYSKFPSVCTDSNVYAYVYFLWFACNIQSLFQYVLIRMLIPMFIRCQQSSKHGPRVFGILNTLKEIYICITIL